MTATAKTKSRRKATEPPALRGRVSQLQRRLREIAADALLVTNPRDIRYLTGFIGEDSWALVPLRGRRVYILSDSRFEEQIQREAPHATAIIRRGGMVDELAALLGRKSIDRITLQPDYVTLAQRRQLAKKLGAKRLVNAKDGLIQQRSIKQDGEIKAIRKALRIQQQAYRETLDFIKPGHSEQEIAAYLEYRMRSLGADGPSFPSIVAIDANAALPHAIPGKKQLKVGSMLLIDWGAKVDGYCSDMTRVVAYQRMKPRIHEIYQITLEAQQAGIHAIRPGATLEAIDAAARQVITDAGFGPQFGHSLGHGIGLDIHEQPSLSPRSQGKLKPGQVVTVEPGIYLPGVGGVRLEDDVLVTQKGGKVLRDLPKGLESAMIGGRN